ncbi:hypothetical protein SAMN05444371_1603 [Epilithonimonas mollis]|uniref:Conjugative transposon protein TraD n=1 Tax=Epilithonimonas mollis TaxID=216903 RepID=A0A1M6QZK6_9FLAO|nr:hypothetical protein SAMN05444371_1603 [Epilithonimonas mollis]
MQDKIVIKWKSEKKPVQEKVNPKLPDIMGHPKPVRSQSVPNSANESQIAEPEINPANLVIEYDKYEEVNIQIPQEELDEVFSSVPDLTEEVELNRYRASVGDDGFAQGVTFQELNNVGVLLQKEKLEPAQKETAIDIVQRLQGTELFALLESSMEGASRKIAELLDSTLTTDTEDSSSNLRKSDLSDFDIGDFV